MRTGDAAVLLFARLIACRSALRTGAPGVQPLPIGVEVILDGVVGNSDIVSWSNFQGFFPSGAF